MMERLIAMLDNKSSKRTRNRSRLIAVLIFLEIWILIDCHRAVAQCTNINDPRTVAWVNAIIASALGQGEACRQGVPDRDNFATSNACSIFVGRVMARMYGLTSFVSPNHSFLKANQIEALIPTWDGWVELGIANDQHALTAAADAVNQGYVVLAVWANPKPEQPGHVALIGPGPLTPSGKWRGLQTPVAAAFALDDVESAFLGQPLACAFSPNEKDSTYLWKYNKVVSPR
jgi:hypothetical protein